MTKVQANMTEMKNADVHFISLVKRAASRIPFRVVKHDLQGNDMSIDLSRVGRIFKSAIAKPEVPATGPEVVAVVINGADEALQTMMVSALKTLEADFPKVVKSEDGSAVTFSPEGELPADVSLVKLSEDVCLVVKGFSPWSDEFRKDSSFAEAAAASGFYSGVDVATGLLRDAVSTALYSSTTKSDAVTAVKKTLGEFGSYVEALAGGLPEKAFKMDAALTDLLKADKVSKAELVSKSAKEAPAKKPAAEDGDGADPEGVKEDMLEGKDGEKATAKKAGDEGLGFAAVLKAALEPLVASIAAMDQKIVEVQKSTEQSIAEIARKAETAANAVKSTILSNAQAEDKPADSVQETKKSDDWRTGSFDSAMHRSR